MVSGENDMTLPAGCNLGNAAVISFAPADFPAEDPSSMPAAPLPAASASAPRRVVVLGGNGVPGGAFRRAKDRRPALVVGSAPR